MASSIPSSDGEFYRLLKAMVTWLKSVAVARGYDSAFINDELEPGFKEFETAYLPCVDKEHRTKEMVARKNAKKKAVKPLYSKAIKMINGNMQTTDDERITLGIAINTGGSHLPLPAKTTSPVPTFDTSHPGRIGTTLRDEGTKSDAMPHDAEVIEVRRAILDHDPASIAELTEHVTLFSTKEVKDYDFEDQGKIVFSIYRYIGPTGKPGPWSVVYKTRIP
jgi:hypothetical protein